MAKPYKSVLTRHQLQQLASTFRHHVEQWLEKKEESYFNRLEEVFFNRAEQASSDALQRTFIDAVRELRRSRQQIGRSFQGCLLKAVETFFLHYEAYLEEFIHGFSPSSQPRESLELVANEKLEEDLVILRTSHRITSGMQARHKELTAYMAAVVQPKDLPQLGMPLAPSVIANCMRMALAEWEGSAVTRHIFYQVLADDMLVDLDTLYVPLIKALQRVGLEPVETTVKRRQARQAAYASQRPYSSHRPSAAENDQATLFSVVSLVRQLNEEEREMLGLPKAVAADRAVGGVAMKPEALATVIHDLQESHARVPAADVVAARSLQRALKQSLAESLDQVLEHRGARLHELDQQIIDIVTMLFDFVLDDPLLPDSMKLLLVRLQMPVLQIAIRDKTFLTNRDHPARRLVNNLSRAAVRWVDSGDHVSDSVHEMIRKSVERILGGDNMDLELYLKVNRDFERFLAHEERGARVAEERVSQVARGKEQLAVARQRVSMALADLMNVDLPPAVWQILDDAWRDVLTLTLLREGEESRNWQESVEVARRLVASVRQAEKLGPGRVQQGAELPRLLGELRQGFASISYDPKKAGQLLDRLEECFRTGRAADQARRMEGEGKPEALADALPVAGEGIQEPDRHERLVRTLREGQWVRWEIPGEGEKRGKLAWRSELADLLLFVDMRGRKLAEITSLELVELFREGRASLLADIDQPFIERAMRCIHRIITEKLARRGPRILPA